MDRNRCPRCGSVFYTHHCHAPVLVCKTCRHPELVHHGTRSGNSTYCTVFSPNKCPCTRYQPTTGQRTA